MPSVDRGVGSAHRSCGTWLMVLLPNDATRHASSKVRTPDGVDSAHPIKPVASCVRRKEGMVKEPSADSRFCSPGAPWWLAGAVVVLKLRCASICLSVGKSKIRVSGSSASEPSRCPRRLRNSVAPSESSPACINGVSAETAAPTSSRATACSAAPTSGADVLGCCEAVE